MKNRQMVVERIREFNRFYTVLTGTLNTCYLGTGYSYTETRILFELKDHGECTATEIIERLSIDKSYMSRILKSFEEKGLIEKKKSETDHRTYFITLTEKGREDISELVERTNEKINGLIMDLSIGQCQEVWDAMDLITNLLKN